VPHRLLNLSVLLERAKSGDAAKAVKAYLDAGGSAACLVHGAGEREATTMQQLPLLHHMVLYNSHPHTELAESVRLLVAAGADINATGADGRAILARAIERRCCTEVLQILLQNDVDVMAPRADGITALHYAAAAGRVDSCALLLARESSLMHLRDLKGCTALMQAVAFGSVPTVELLCQHGADMSTVDNSKATPLIAACTYKRADTAAFLLKAGADVNAVDCNGQSALMAAARSNSTAVAELLLEHGAGINSTDEQGRNALFIAASEGHLCMMQLLVGRGLSLTAVDNKGCTLLIAAAAGAYVLTAEWLLQQGVAVDAVNRDGSTALHYATLHSGDDTAMIELLLASGADVHKHAITIDSTALGVAAINGHMQCTRVLIAAGADVNSANSRGLTSLHFAVIEHLSAVAQLLLEHGATAVINSVVPWRCPKSIEHCCVSGVTALMMCATVDTVKVLLAAGADVHVTTAAGDTCLHKAAAHALPVPVVCLLIKAGVDLLAVNNAGKTAAQVAHAKGHALIEQILNRAAAQQQER
jgi:uncharacterized protein